MRALLTWILHRGKLKGALGNDHGKVRAWKHLSTVTSLDMVSEPHSEKKMVRTEVVCALQPGS